MGTNHAWIEISRAILCWYGMGLTPLRACYHGVNPRHHFRERGTGRVEHDHLRRCYHSQFVRCEMARAENRLADVVAQSRVHCDDDLRLSIRHARICVTGHDWAYDDRIGDVVVKKYPAGRVALSGFCEGHIEATHYKQL